jgi:micrococcal nuclease
MKKRTLKIISVCLGIIILLLILGIIYLISNLDKNPPIPNKEEYLYKVTDVIDGDTIVIERANYIRLIGINAPEKNQPYYEEAKEFLTELLLNKTVRLEKDLDNSDNYGRLLRYVFLEGNNKEIFINAELVKRGFAIPMFVEPNIKYKEEIEKARENCIENKMGLCVN